MNFAEAVRELTGGDGVNVVYDAVGAETWEGSIDSLKRRGMVVFFGGASGPVPTFDTSTLATKGSLVLSRVTLRDFVFDGDEIAWRASELFDLWAADQLKIRSDRLIPLAEAGTAHADLENRRSTGKLLLQI